MTKRASKNELNYFYRLILEEKSEEALREIKRLYRLYPNDYLVVGEYGDLLLKLKINTNEALYLLSLSMNEGNKDKINYDIGNYYLSNGDFIKAYEFFSKISDNDEKTRCFKIYGELKVYIQEEDYAKALECCQLLRNYRNNGLFNFEHFKNARSFVYYKLGIYNTNFITDNYFNMQLINYSRDYAIEHIKDHMPKLNDEENVERLIRCIFNIPKGVHSTFCEEVDIEKLYDKSLEYINNTNPTTYGIIDYYLMDTGRLIGSSYSGVDTNFVEISAFPNSKNILSIYPTNKDHINKKPVEITHERDYNNRSSKQDYKKKLKKKPRE